MPFTNTHDPDSDSSPSAVRRFLHPASLPPEILDTILSFFCAPTPFNDAEESASHLYLSLSRTCRAFYQYLCPWIYRNIILIPRNFTFSYGLSLLIRSILTCRGEINVAEYIRSLKIRRGRTVRPARRIEELGLLWNAHRRMLSEMVDIELGWRLWDETDLVGQVVEGVPDVLVGVLIGLLAKRGRGQLRELRVAVPIDNWPVQLSQFEGFLWRVLGRIIPRASSSTPFPHLATVQITAADLGNYEPSMLQLILLPLFRLPALSHLSITTLEMDSFRPASLPASPTGIPALTHLTLRLDRPDALNAILALTPNLTSLDVTFCMHSFFSAGEVTHTTVSCEDLGAALQLVKRTLRELVMHVDNSQLSYYDGEEAPAGFGGDSSTLRLRECAELRKLTIALRMLMHMGRSGSNGRVEMAELLPDRLEELWLRRDRERLYVCDETKCEQEGIVRVLAEYVRDSGAGAIGGNGSLRKLGGFRNIGYSWDSVAVKPWLDYGLAEELMRIADECGIVCFF